MEVRTHQKTLSKGRRRLAKVAARARPFIDVQTAANALGMNAQSAAKQLSRWQEQGLVRRVRSGVYAIVPPAATTQRTVVTDPWVLVPTLFNEAYVGGWSAAEHWDLTEQVFTTLLVCTTDALKKTHLEVSGLTVRARHISSKLMFGTAVTWHEGTRVLVSDVHKTVLDLFIAPEIGGGIQHVTHCFREYLRRDDANVKTLAAYASKARVAPALKRMGFVCEAIEGPQELRDACLRGVTLGLANLDSAIESPGVSKRWQLRIPKDWKRALGTE